MLPRLHPVTREPMDPGPAPRPAPIAHNELLKGYSDDLHCLPCVVTWHSCEGQTETHHEPPRDVTLPGTDFLIVPLCKFHHAYFEAHQCLPQFSAEASREFIFRWQARKLAALLESQC